MQLRLKKKRNETTKKKEKSFSRREFNPRPLTCKGNALSIAPRQVTLSKNFKFVIFNIFCPWNSAGGRCLELVELYLWRIERYIRGKKKQNRMNDISLKTMRLGVLSWEKSKNRETHGRIVSLDQLEGRRAYCWSFRHVYRLNEPKSFKSS